MKFQLTLATIATLGSACLTQLNAHQDDIDIEDIDEDCLGEWEWEECSQLWWRANECTDDWGYWYTPDDTIDCECDDWWVSGEEWEEWEKCDVAAYDDDWSVDCLGDWEWEECSGLYRQSDDCFDDLGWWYTEKENEEELSYDWSGDYWVSAADWIDWEECYHEAEAYLKDEDMSAYELQCYSEREYEECSGLWFYSDYCRDECGEMYEDDEDGDYWVSCDEYDTWVECQ